MPVSYVIYADFESIIQIKKKKKKKKKKQK